MAAASRFHSERLDFLRSYISTTEYAISFADDQLIVREIARLKRDGFSSDDDYAQDRVGGLQIYGLDVADTLRAQMIILVWAYFENLFASAMKSLAKYHNKNREFKKYGGHSLVQSWKKYVSQILEVDLELAESDWLTLSDISQVRNFVAHSSDKPGHSPKAKQKDACSRLPGVRIVLDGISVSYAFLESLLDFAETILTKLGGEHWLNSERLSFSR
jgi:hypothetical protein